MDESLKTMLRKINEKTYELPTLVQIVNKYKSKINVEVLRSNKVCKNSVKILEEMSKIFNSLKTITIVGDKLFTMIKDYSPIS